MEVHFQTGVTDDFDLGVTVWNSSLISTFEFSSKKKRYDAGMSLNAKYLLATFDDIRNLSVGLAVVGQTAGYTFDEYGWRHITYGIAPQILYSRVLTAKNGFPAIQINSIYLGLRTFILQTELTNFKTGYKHFENSSSFTTIIYDPTLGISGSAKSTKFFLEIHPAFFKHPLSGEMQVAVYAGIGAKFYLN